MVRGAPGAVRDELERLAADYGVDELLVVTVTHEHEARRRSYELLADVFAMVAPSAASGTPAPARVRRAIRRRWPPA